MITRISCFKSTFYFLVNRISIDHKIPKYLKVFTHLLDLEEIGINAGNWVDSAQDRNYWRALVNAALNLRVP